jgi:hypothetical protein
MEKGFKKSKGIKLHKGLRNFCVGSVRPHLIFNNFFIEVSK